MPDRRAGEAVDDDSVRRSRKFRLGMEKCSGDLGGESHFFSGTTADALGITITPHIGRENRLVPLVNWVAHGLSYQMAGDRVASQTVISEELPFFAEINRRGGSGIDIEVISPTCEFKAVVAHLFGQRG
jgi:hypothetical protein